MLEILLLSLLLARPATAGGAPLATVVNASGDVRVARAGKRLPAEVGLALQTGDVIATKEKSSAWLVYRSGRVHKLGPNKRETLREQGDKKPARGKVASILHRLGLFGSPETGRLGNLGGGIRPGRQQQFFILAPRRSYVRHPIPAIRWTPVKKASLYRVKVASIGKDLLSREVKQPALDLDASATKLPRGQLYFVTVEARSGDRVLASDQTTFTVASDQAQADLDRIAGELKQGFAQDDFSYRLVLAELYLRKTFYAEALTTLHELHRKRPKSAWLKQRIDSLNRIVGLPIGR